MKRLTFLGMLLIFLMLAGCGGGFNEEDFAGAIETGFEDADWGDYNELVCDRDRIRAETEGTTEDLNVECSLDGSTVDCDISSNDSEDTMSITAVLDDDDKACDVTLVLPTGEMTNLREMTDVMAEMAE